MWLICVLACITLEVVIAKNVPRKGNESPLMDYDLEFRSLDYLDKGYGNRDQRWPLGIVSYYFDHSSYDYLVAERVRLAMNNIEETSCVRFKPILEPWSESPWIHITNKARVRDCTHETATNGSLEIVMTMGIDCLQRRDILHLLMHALGFKDEITHPKRDQYVRVLWENINPAFRTLFRIDHDDFPSKTTEYDPMSIMHFHDRAFTKNGQATIASLIPGLVINPSRELSPLDKMKLRLMFGHECNRREVGDLLDSCKNVMQDGRNDDNETEETKLNDEEEIKEPDPNIEGTGASDGENTNIEESGKDNNVKDENESANIQEPSSNDNVGKQNEEDHNQEPSSNDNVGKQNEEDDPVDVKADNSEASNAKQTAKV